MSTSESDFVNILTHLYSRKANKRTFNEIRKAYKAETKKDLCDVIEEAHREIIHDINNLKPGQVGDQLRTKAFKLIDYETWIGYCKGDRRGGKKDAED